MFGRQQKQGKQIVKRKKEQETDREEGGRKGGTRVTGK
jgi:hypothetical protein